MRSNTTSTTTTRCSLTAEDGPSQHVALLGQHAQPPLRAPGAIAVVVSGSQRVARPARTPAVFSRLNGGEQHSARPSTPAKILGVREQDVALYTLSPGTSKSQTKCKIHPSAWDALQADAEVHAKIERATKKAKKAKQNKEPKPKPKAVTPKQQKESPPKPIPPIKAANRPLPPHLVLNAHGQPVSRYSFRGPAHAQALSSSTDLAQASASSSRHQRREGTRSVPPPSLSAPPPDRKTVSATRPPAHEPFASERPRNQQVPPFQPFDPAALSGRSSVPTQSAPPSRSAHTPAQAPGQAPTQAPAKVPAKTPAQAPTKAPAPAPAPVPQNQHRRPIKRPAPDDDDDEEFTLIAVQQPPPRSPSASSSRSASIGLGVGSGDDSRARRRYDSEYEQDREQEQEQDELADDSDWSITLKLPSSSSGKRWSAKEHALFYEKLQAETAGIREHLSSDERRAFFLHFAEKYSRLFNSRTADAFHRRLCTLRAKARSEGRSLPKPLQYLFRPGGEGRPAHLGTVR